jgi:hypothetical protein
VVLQLLTSKLCFERLLSSHSSSQLAHLYQMAKKKFTEPGVSSIIVDYELFDHPPLKTVIYHNLKPLPLD